MWPDSLASQVSIWLDLPSRVLSPTGNKQKLLLGSGGTVVASSFDVTDAVDDM